MHDGLGGHAATHLDAEHLGALLKVPSSRQPGRRYCPMQKLIRSLASLIFVLPVVAADDVGEYSFRDQVRPILSNHCFACHGPDPSHRKADLRLDVAGEVDLDALIERVASDDPEFVMPPPEFNKRLTASQIATLKQWAEAGGVHEQHWSFVPPALPEIPLAILPVSDRSDGPEHPLDTSEQPIDRFVRAELLRRNLRSSPRADRRTRIRRVTLDLTGLPPTPAEIQEFLSDRSEDAYDRLIDRLLRQPAYGEHMARFWLDLVRFADTNGLHHDHYREMTPYRDWVIRSFNNNLPFDQFASYQIAGDLFDDPTADQQIASGFHRLHLIIDQGTALPEESQFRNVVDRVSAVGTAFLGLTLQCAVCHDHKYDPVTQKEFYQLAAFFNNFDGAPETGSRGTLDFRRGLQPPYLEFPTDQQAARLQSLNAEIARREKELQELKKQQEERPKQEASQPSRADGNSLAVANEAAGQRDAINKAIQSVESDLRASRKKRDALVLEIPAALVMKERAEVRPTFVMQRGAYDQPGEPVQRATPAFLPPCESESTLLTRRDLARWLTDPGHPLMARVTVNRFWQQLFGVGLVRTAEDFGSQGEAPTHPELLDYLSVRFVQSGWNVKQLVAEMVRSETYQQSSVATPDQFVDDAQNRWLARGSRYRLDAEVVRDQTLFVTGLLHQELYGKSVKPPQPEGLWKIVAMPSSFPNTFQPDRGPATRRRSVYTFWKRGMPPPQMTVLDAPTRESCIARRERTNTPLQALLLMNEKEYFAAARHYARTLLQSPEISQEQRIDIAFETITATLPSDRQRDRLLQGLEQFQAFYRAHPDLAHALDDGPDGSDGSDRSPNETSDASSDAIGQDPESAAEVAAWTMIVHSLLNLDVTRTRE